jgi:NTP pyrophosphatase (non-canonical NTP hydrolase)
MNEIKIEQLQKWAKEIHKNAKAKGFYDRSNEKLFDTHQVYEIVKEIAEFHEAYKKGRSTPLDIYLQDYAEEIGKEKDVFEALVKNTYQDELADIVIRSLDYLEHKGDIDYLHDFKLVKEDISDYFISAICATISASALNFEINDVVIYIKCLSNLLDVNLLWHIKAKMAYNATREKLHGKKF